MVEVGQAGFADGEQLAVAGYGLHKTGTLADAEGRDAEVAALADLAGGDGVDDLDGELGQKAGTGDEGLGETLGGGEGLEVGEGACAMMKSPATVRRRASRWAPQPRA